MAHFYDYKNGNHRAQVEKRGIRESKNFKTREAAEKWAKEREDKIEAEYQSGNTYYARMKEIQKILSMSQGEFMDRMIPAHTFSGVYLLFDNDDLVYIGKARNIMRRVVEHAKSGRSFTHYTAIKCIEEDLSELEQELIKRFKPKQNIMHLHSWKMH